MGEIVRILEGTNGAYGKARDGRLSASNGDTRLGPSRAKYKEAQRRMQRIAQAVRRCVHERLAHSLDGITLRDVCDEVGTEVGEPLDHRYVFHI